MGKSVVKRGFDKSLSNPGNPQPPGARKQDQGQRTKDQGQLKALPNFTL